jgi:uncharacterized LabA/DUF88 family protein
MARVLGGRPIQPWEEPPSGRLMIFIDGENLVGGYQRLVSEGRQPTEAVQHLPDVYVWHSSSTALAKVQSVLRATYYTYAVGSDETLVDINKAIKAMSFTTVRRSGLPQNLTPYVFHKQRREVRAKGVDIKLTVDVLTHVHRNNVDAVYLLTGDGDYAPLIEEVLRSGKQVYVSEFSSGLNPALPKLADDFSLLDSVYFE